MADRRGRLQYGATAERAVRTPLGEREPGEPGPYDPPFEARRGATRPAERHGHGDLALAAEPVSRPLGLSKQGRQDASERDELPTARLQPGGPEGRDRELPVARPPPYVCLAAGDERGGYEQYPRAYGPQDARDHPPLRAPIADPSAPGRQAARRWWQSWWQYVGAFAGTSGHAARTQVAEILAAAHVLLACAGRFPSWTSPVRPRSPALSKGRDSSGLFRLAPSEPRGSSGDFSIAEVPRRRGLKH